METYKEVVRQSDKNSRLLKTTVGLNVKNVTHTIHCNHHCLQTDLLVQLRPTCHSTTTSTVWLILWFAHNLSVTPACVCWPVRLVVAILPRSKMSSNYESCLLGAQQEEPRCWYTSTSWRSTLVSFLTTVVPQSYPSTYFNPNHDPSLTVNCAQTCPNWCQSRKLLFLPLCFGFGCVVLSKKAD